MKIVCFGTIYAVSLIVFWKVDFLSFLQDFQKFMLNYRICSKVCKWGVPQQKMGMFHIKYGKIKDGPKNTKWSPPTIPRDRQTCIFCDLNLLQISGLTKARVREGADAQVKYGLISQFPPGPMHTYKWTLGGSFVH